MNRMVRLNIIFTVILAITSVLIQPALMSPRERPSSSSTQTLGHETYTRNTVEPQVNNKTFTLVNDQEEFTLVSQNSRAGEKLSQVVSQPPPFDVPSPTGSGRLVGQNYQWDGNPHRFPEYDVRLIRQDGSDSGWIIPAVVFAAWSEDGGTFALEDSNHNVYIGTLYSFPVALPERYVTPALSPSGKHLVAQKLGDGEDMFEQIANSPGMVLRELAKNSERVVASGDVYAPFFIDDNRVGFGSGKDDHRASVYTVNLKDNKVTRLTNRSGNTEALEPFPSSPPKLSKDRKHLIFSVTENGRSRLHKVSLDQTDSATIENHHSTLKPETGASTSFRSGGVSSSSPLLAKVLFQRPLPSYTGIYKFYDHNNRDWGCGSITYGGHQGTDFKADVGTPVYAAAQGSLYDRYDNCADTGYFGSTCGGGFGNHARIEHSDGRVTIYGHLKRGTVIDYAGVTCGRYIGSTASSGSSSAPHLHFELRSSRNTTAARIDPYYGSCDPGDGTDWISQSSYPSGNTRHSCLPSWFFNTTGNREGWSAFNAASTSVSSGILFVDPGSGDFYISSPPISVVAASNQYVQLRMATNAVGNKARIYFKTRVEDYYSADKWIEFTVNNCGLCGNAPFYSYTIYAGWHPKWANSITGIRLDPAENGTGGTNRDSVGIDYIRITTL